jgi:hypothetical protein
MQGLTAVEDELQAAVVAGRRFDLAGGAPIAHADMDGWGAEREVRADVVREILLGRAGEPADPRGIRLRGARIVGRLDLDGLRSDVWFSLHDCDLPERIRLRGADLPLLDLNGCRSTGLDAENLRVRTVVLLRDGFVSTGPVSLIGASVRGKLDLAGARIAFGGGTALAATGLVVGGSAYLNDGLAVVGAGRFGAIRLVGARIGGLLSLRDAALSNPDGPAIVADNVEVQDIATLAGLTAEGAGREGVVRLIAIRVGGALSLGNARVTNTAGGVAVVATYARVGGTLYLDGLRATGMVRLAGGHLGRLLANGAEIASTDRAALDGARLVVGQHVELQGAVLRNAAHDHGTVNLPHAQIGGELDLRRATLDNAGDPGGRGGPALRLTQATIAGPTLMYDTVVERGSIGLRGATLGMLVDDPGRLPATTRLRLDGLTYRGIPGNDPVVNAPARLRVDWLRRMDPYAAQPYRQLATAYQAAGHEDDARRILIAQQRHLLDAPDLLGGWGRLRQRVLGVTLGYGYEVWRAVVGLLATVLTAVLLLVVVGSATARVPTGGGPAVASAGHCAVVERLGLAVDEAVPLLDTGARDRCDLLTVTGAGQAVAASTLVLRLLGWAFATLVVAGYTGLVRRG